MVIFVKPNGATVVENDVIGLGSFVGKIAVVSPTRTGAYVTLHVAPAHGEYLKPMYCAPMISTDVEDLGIYLCDMTRSISAVAGRVRYQVSFVYEDGREEFTPEGSFTVSQGVVSIPPDDPSESMYNAIRSALIANINNYTEIVEKLDMVWEAKTLVEENLEKINESKEAAEKAANHAQNISENFDVVASDVLKEAKESGMFDGVSVTHEWDGSVLRVTSASGTSERDLRGPEGKRGETGKGFEISKTYASVLQMHADYGNPAVPLYGFVLIDTGNVEDEDNAKLFVKQEDGYQFLIDLSGSEGIKGERGYSAYETAVKLGFIGAEDEWIASLKKPAEDAASEARASEKVRDANENARIADENTRKLNEAAREDAEYHRRAISEDIVTRAENALTLANDAKAEAIQSASAAGESERNARSSETAAESARLAAERARDDAEAIVGGDFASDADVSNQIGIHNTNTAAHNDIRLLIEGLTSRINTLANSDDTTLDQMAEVVAYIKANRDLISQITTNKVNVGDIVNDLATNVSNKPLSAAQGVALKALIDAIKIPTSLPASDVYSWAKQPNKPSYSASEVGARPNTWTPSASEVGAGTFGGQVVANASGQAAGTSLLRNSRIVSADTNPTVNGEICWTYK